MVSQLFHIVEEQLFLIILDIFLTPFTFSFFFTFMRLFSCVLLNKKLPHNNSPRSQSRGNRDKTSFKERARHPWRTSKCKDDWHTEGPGLGDKEAAAEAQCQSGFEKVRTDGNREHSGQTSSTEKERAECAAEVTKWPSAHGSGLRQSEVKRSKNKVGNPLTLFQPNHPHSQNHRCTSKQINTGAAHRRDIITCLSITVFRNEREMLFFWIHLWTVCLGHLHWSGFIQKKKKKKRVTK